MKENSHITYNTKTGEVRALLTDFAFKNFVMLFSTEILMLHGAGERDDHGRREYVFTMPDDGRRELLMDFLDRIIRTQSSLN